MPSANDAMVAALAPFLIRWVRTQCSLPEIERIECAKETANAMCQLIDTKHYKAYWPVLACVCTLALSVDEETPIDDIITDLRVEQWQYDVPPNPIHRAVRNLSDARLDVWVHELGALCALLGSMASTASSMSMTGTSQWLHSVRTMVSDDLILVRAGASARHPPGPSHNLAKAESP